MEGRKLPTVRLPSWMRIQSRAEIGGHRMRKLRLDANVSLREMAKLIRCSPNAISMVENCKAPRNVGPELIDRYMRVLMAKKVCKNRDRLEVFWLLQVFPPEVVSGMFAADVESFIQRARYAGR